MQAILYLDYDGVLHPADVRVTRDEPLQPKIFVAGQSTDLPLFEHARLLERVLAPFPDVKISLATSWVRTLGYEAARDQLPLELRKRTVGTIWQGALLTFPPQTRYDAIQTDVEERRVEHWLALDDDVLGWPDQRRYRVVAPNDSWLGLAQPGIAEQLTAALELLSTGRLFESR